jgi:hypothetical protein
VATVLNTQALLPSGDSPSDGDCPLPLVQIIELKWLLAGHGLHIHVERLQRDPAYARSILGAAAALDSPVLCAIARRLLARLPSAG